MDIYIYNIIEKASGKVLYVGSTKNFSQRNSGHKHKYNKNCNNLIYQKIKELGGWNFIEIEIIHECKCENKKEQLKKEKEWIEKIKPLYNNKRPVLSIEEKINYQKNYNKENKENKTNYYYKNKEIINEKRKEKIICECGKHYTYTHKQRHEKTKKHQSFILSNQELIHSQTIIS